ncbi:MAG: rod shape-determining protein MreC [Myxococcales bacterium]
MLALIRRYREVLALLALLTLAAFTYATRSRTVQRDSRIDRAVIWLTAPIERAVTWTVGGGIDLWQSYVSLRRVREQNVRLNRELAASRAEIARLAEIEGENGRLRGLLDFGKSEPLQLLSARVIGDSLAPGALSRVIRVGAGVERGVRKGMAVVTAGGVVGHVQSVFGGAADVQLLVDPESRLAVRAARTRARATVSGTGSDRRCRLDFALRADDFEEGDALLTSGTDDIYPPGLPVGKVVGLSRKGAGNMFVAAQVEPAVDMRRLEDVMIVLGQSGSLTDVPAASK